jgi:hypothetical protein
MEISLLYKNCLRIKGKRATFVFDPVKPSSTAGKQDKVAYDATIVMTQPRESLNIAPESVVIDGPGEYEICGVKMSAVRDRDGGVVYALIVDGVEIQVGKISSFEKLQNKLKEQNVVVAYGDAASNASFVTSLASNVVIFYGDQVETGLKSVSTIGKAVETVSKFSVTYDKLPQEVETVVLG